MQSKSDAEQLNLVGSCLTWPSNTAMHGNKYLVQGVQHTYGVLGM